MSSATFTLVSVYAQSAAADGSVVFAAHYLGVGCSGQLIPDSKLGRSSAFAGGIPSL